MEASTSHTWPREAVTVTPPQREATVDGISVSPVFAGLERFEEWVEHVPGMKGDYLRAFLSQPVEKLIANIRTEFRVIQCGPLTLPVCINSRERNNSYPCSLHAQYVGYPLEELGLVQPRWLRHLARPALQAFGVLLRAARIDQAVQLNAWLLSTNLIDSRTFDHLEAITRFLQRACPNHLILLKNLNDFAGPSELDSARAAGFDLWLSRQIYFFDGRTREFLTRQTVKRDFKFAREQSNYIWLRHEDFEEADAPRIAQLYRLLYLEKHSGQNPAYTEAFVQRAIRYRLLEFRGLRNKATGQIDAVMGNFHLGETTSVPFIGYDTALPQENGLYRLLFSDLLREVGEKNLVLNYSSGAGEFKRRRGGVPVLEYNALFTRHLSPVRRMTLKVIQMVMNPLAKEFLVRNQI